MTQGSSFQSYCTTSASGSPGSIQLLRFWEAEFLEQKYIHLAACTIGKI